MPLAVIGFVRCCSLLFPTRVFGGSRSDLDAKYCRNLPEIDRPTYLGECMEKVL